MENFAELGKKRNTDYDFPPPLYEGGLYYYIK